MRYICEACGVIYDPVDGDPDGGIPPGTAFADIAIGGRHAPRPRPSGAHTTNNHARPAQRACANPAISGIHIG